MNYAKRVQEEETLLTGWEASLVLVQHKSSHLGAQAIEKGIPVSDGLKAAAGLGSCRASVESLAMAMAMALAAAAAA